MAEAGELRRRLQDHLLAIYPDLDVGALADSILDDFGLTADAKQPASHRNLWSEQDAVLITYGNSIVSADEPPLRTLQTSFLPLLQDSFNVVHVLPFFPYSSDDGFAVIDYYEVNPSLGTWTDLESLGAKQTLMSDLVINHVSSRSGWFENYKQGREPGRDYFIELAADTDVSAVVRPRSTPLLTRVRTQDGDKHVWTTFGPDQVDLNFANPAVLREFARILVFYLDHGVRWLRLDAVAFLWKEPGTSCLHLSQTHEIIKLLRMLVEHRCPDAVIITETNVPNVENLTYFGNANEAHVIYNFSLPPLLLHALVSGNCKHLKSWMMSMPPAQSGTAYLNFIASHDGIGLRPLDGLLDDDERERLLECMHSFGGLVSSRIARTGEHKAYEINIALFDAFKGTMYAGVDDYQIQRYLCAHTIMLSLEGIPAFYIHSLLGTENDDDRALHSGNNRAINRHIWDWSELHRRLDDPLHHHAKLLEELLQLLALRKSQPAFHPNATQFTLHLGEEVFAFWRQSISRNQSIFCINNVTNEWQEILLSDVNLIGTDRWWDLITGQEITTLDGVMPLAPYQCVWLSNLGREHT